jgi:nucleoside phosphorylase
MTLKTLLIFAHYGEAQAFIEKPLTNTDVLICGEGMTNALYKTTEQLIRENENYHTVVNLGVAGNLKGEPKIGDIYSIKTVYADNEFKSFKLDDPKAEIDLISAPKRIKNKEEREYLSHYAHLVDRELWAIAYACSKRRLKLVSYKLITDNADEAFYCENILENAKKLSTQLYDFYVSQILTQGEQQESIGLELPLEWNGVFHFSLTQRKKLENLLDRLALLGITNCLNTEIIDDCKKVSPLPKERANYLLRKLSHQLNPTMAKVEEKLDNLVAPLSNIGAKIHFSPDFEEDYFTISMKIENEKNLNRLKESIDKINYQAIVNVLNGSLDV